MGLRVRVSSEKLEKPGMDPTTPGLEGEKLNHYTRMSSFENSAGNIQKKESWADNSVSNTQLSSCMNFLSNDQTALWTIHVAILGPPRDTTPAAGTTNKI